MYSLLFSAFILQHNLQQLLQQLGYYLINLDER